MIASTSRLLLEHCPCGARLLDTAARRSLSTSTTLRIRRNWFIDRDAKRRQVAEPFLDELLAGPSAFKDVDTKDEVDLSYVDRQTERSVAQPRIVPRREVQEEAGVEAKPWYVKAEYADLPGELGREVDLAPLPLPPPPEHLPEHLHPVYETLVNSLWVDGYTTTWIDAKAGSDDGNTYTDWIIICTVNAERERAMAGAVGPMKAVVRDMIRALYPQDYPLPADDLYEDAQGRRQPGVRVEGYQRHHPDWILFDGGCVMLHVFSKAARETWNLEEHWIKAAKARKLDDERGVHPFFSAQARGPASGFEGRDY